MYKPPFSVKTSIYPLWYLNEKSLLTPHIVKGIIFIHTCTYTHVHHFNVLYPPVHTIIILLCFFFSGKGAAPACDTANGSPGGMDVDTIVGTCIVAVIAIAGLVVAISAVFFIIWQKKQNYVC